MIVLYCLLFYDRFGIDILVFLGLWYLLALWYCGFVFVFDCCLLAYCLFFSCLGLL